MKVTGIIAEYNPFHNGHLYHLTRAREKTGAAAVICVMSGNFMQRGEPAIVDKWARAEMALANGADLVLELPALYATRSAYWFARGGIETLYRTGVVTHLSFGVETHEPDMFLKTARLLVQETPEFRSALKRALKKGHSFPKARSLALAGEFMESAVWNKPNNILALTYIQVLQEMKIPLEPVPVTRKGAGYEETQLAPGRLPSATAIRHRIINSGDGPLHVTAGMEEFLPQTSIKILCREFEKGRGPVSREDMDRQVMTLLRRSSESELLKIVDLTEGLENRIVKTAQMSVGISDFLDKLKTKRYTYTRLQRFLVHLLLNYTKDKESVLKGGPPYLRILGFTSTGRKLIKKIKETSMLPVITKAAHCRKFSASGETFSVFWETDLLAASLYSLLYPAAACRHGNADYFRAPVNLS
ncbi:MAG: nucleotidyltransferase [Peptococcaceae bacterium]|nr:nucleotidyltransferase [Peptococcaceae bacterium]MDH7525475.1 nucleotidyltransferase [Peptococcaceae bacterium]